MKFGLSFGHLCVAITLGLLLLLGQSPTEAKALRTYTGQQRQLEDYAGDDAVQGDDAAQGDDNAGDDAAEEEEQQEQDQEEEGEEDDEDNENYADGQYDSNGNDFNDASTGEGMFDTSPRNWEVSNGSSSQRWFCLGGLSLVVFVMRGGAALASRSRSKKSTKTASCHR